MRRFSWILTLPLLVAVVIFAVANRDAVTLNLWPLDRSGPVPLFVVVLGSAFAGLLIGGVAAWLSGAETRRRARHARHRVSELERELDRLRRERERAAATPPASASEHMRLPAAPGSAAEHSKLPVASA